jgi:virginiamycin B lyase
MDSNRTVQAVFIQPTTVGNFTEFAVASSNSNMRNITAGPDGNLWVTQGGVNKIAKVSLDGTVREYDTTSRVAPFDIVAGSDQALWFTMASTKVGRITTDGVATEYAIGSVPNATPVEEYGIATGPDGNVWVAEQNANAVSKITPSGAFTRYWTPGLSGGPRHIATGPDGNLWFTEAATNKIARITPAGEITEFAVPTANAALGDITRGADGAMWFIEEQARKIGRITMSGAITEFSVNSTTALSGASITSGPDQNLWFTYGTAPKLGQMTQYGVLTTYNTLSANGTTRGIATGSDGNIWYTDSTANKIGRLTLRAVRQGAVFSTAQDTARSFLRFANTGTSSGHVSVSLLNPDTGVSINHWTSPNIAPNSSAQFYIDTIERAGNATVTKPQYYSVAVRPHMAGYMQHVLWKPSDGTLTNLSTCDSGVTATEKQLFNVHSTLLDQGYPSAIAVVNTGTSATSVQLGIYDAETGTKLGTYTTATISAGAQLSISIATLESGANVSPGETRYHYVIKAESTFTGYLQHLLTNKSTGVITDMSTVCSLTKTPETARSAVLNQGSVFPSTQPESRSFVRLYNSSGNAGTATISIANAASGEKLREWTSPTIPAGAAHQIAIRDIEGESIGSSDKYVLTARAKFDGAFQHILWRPSDGTLTNLTTCNASVTADSRQLMNVHSSLLSASYPSSIVVNNSGPTAQRVLIGLYDATTGAKLGTYVSDSISAEGHILLTIDQIENGANVKPGATIYHYVLKLESELNGYLQHLVNNKSTGVITNMTTMCLMKAS